MWTKIAILRKKCFRCSSTTFTDKPTHTIMYEKTREIAIDPKLHERQKELAKKYNKKNYRNIIKRINDEKNKIILQLIY